MDSSNKTPKPKEAPLPIGIDFGGPLGRDSNNPPPRRTTQQPNLPEPPGDWSKNKPPEYPSLF